jgi:hypothetical protein
MLRMPGEHPSFFDHAQDHLPGMVLAEGARQLAVHLVLEVYGLSVAKMILTGIDATFTRFGELEAQTRLVATADGDGSRAFPIQVDVQQNGEVISRLDCTLSPTAAWPPDASRG